LREMEQSSAARSQVSDEPPTAEMQAPTASQLRDAEQRAAARRTGPPRPPPGARNAAAFARGTQPTPAATRSASGRGDPRRSTQPPRQRRDTGRSAPAAKPPPGMSEDDSRKLYRRYVQARKLVGERTDNLSYDRLMRTLNKQAPQIMKQHSARGVEFGIVIKGDKVVLKAKPKK
jgi:hypothetical protein